MLTFFFACCAMSALPELFSFHLYFRSTLFASVNASAPVLHRFVPFVSPQQSVMLSSRSALSLRDKCRRRSLGPLRASGGKATSVFEMSTGSGEKIVCANPSVDTVSSHSSESVEHLHSSCKRKLWLNTGAVDCLKSPYI